jgi:hypothetical protein
MKPKSRVLVSLIFALTATTLSCQKHDSQLTDAVITGWDGTMCACCGGLMINFDGETKPYKGSFKLIENLADLGVSEKEQFPVYVKVLWSPVPNKCSDRFVRIDKLVRR